MCKQYAYKNSNRCYFAFVQNIGLTFTEKWTTDNILTTEIANQDKIAPGLKLALETSFAPDSGYVLNSISSVHRSKF